MFKLFIFALAICAASAGIIGHGVAVAPVAVAHAAQSYQNNNQISVHPVPVVATHAVGVAHAVNVAHAAPIAVAAAPVVAVGHGGLEGLGGAGYGSIGGLGGLGGYGGYGGNGGHGDIGGIGDIGVGHGYFH